MLLTTQYLGEAETLADRIAILHQGTIIQNATLAELKALLPPARLEYVEKQLSLEDVFLSLVGDPAEADTVPGDRARRNACRKGNPMTTHVLGDTDALTGRSLRHILPSPDTVITAQAPGKLIRGNVALLRRTQRAGYRGIVRRNDSAVPAVALKMGEIRARSPKTNMALFLFAAFESHTPCLQFPLPFPAPF